jgi:hypothetical protein
MLRVTRGQVHGCSLANVTAHVLPCLLLFSCGSVTLQDLSTLLWAITHLATHMLLLS